MSQPRKKPGASEVKAALRERVEELAPFLFPNGKRDGAHWCVANISGAPGKSFKICLTGEKAGLWGDFADSRKHSKSLLDLWMEARNLDFKTALDEARQWTGQSSNGSHPPKQKPPQKTNDENAQPINWQQCVEAFTEKHLEQLSDWRGYSGRFCSWLERRGVVGVYEGKYGDCIAFPVEDNDGHIIAAHCRPKSGKWFYEPGVPVQPFIIGDLRTANQVHVFESQWDMFAFTDRTDLYKEPGVAFVATRGCDNAKLVKGLFRKGVSVCAWPQNDEPGMKWLNELPKYSDVPVAKAMTRAPHKDMNEWTKAGATVEDIYGALFRNELVKVPAATAAALPLLLSKCETGFKNNITFVSDHVPVVLAIWVAHTHCVQYFNRTPYLSVSSPTKQCGKTNLLICLFYLCARAWFSVCPSVAVLFRKIERDMPTLLLDEADRRFTDGEDSDHDLLGILNAGYKRGATVDRCGGPNKTDLETFNVFCPKAFAGIGRLPDTTEDRCLPIRMERQPKHSKRFLDDVVAGELTPVGDGFAKWAARPELKDELAFDIRQSDFPVSLTDRAVEVCEPLYKIAKLAGGDWYKRIREATAAICGSEEEQDKSVLRLAAIRDAFGPDQFVTSTDLVDRIREQDDPPFPDWWFKKDVDHAAMGRSLARMLKPFKVKPGRDYDAKGERLRGYKRSDLDPVWSAYL